MKILLIFPQYSHSSEFDSRAPSMSLFYLAAQLEQGGHEVRIYDASLGEIIKIGKVYRYGDSEQVVEENLKKNDFDVVGISCSFTARWKFVKKIAQQVKKIKPNTPIAIGGLFPTSEWEYCLTNEPAIDMILLGEAELTFLEIVNKLDKGKNISEACQKVEGVAWRDNNQLKHNAKLNYIENIDILPFPAWHLIDIQRYFRVQKRIFELPSNSLPILSSRSCPYGCSFCNMYVTHGSRWRARSAKNVLDELEYLVTKFKVRYFYFVDDNFSVDRKRAKEICKGIIERKLKIKFNFHNGLSIKTLDFELIQLMKKSGCTSVCLAIESGSERIRNDVYNKKLKTEKVFEVFGWCKKVGIPTIGYFMVGGPGETREDFEKTKELISRLPISLATVSIYTPYSQTRLYDDCKDKGYLKENETDQEDRVEMFSAMVETPDFNQDDVIRWQRELYLSFIKYHWPTLLKEAIRPWGVVNLDMMGKFLGMLRFHGVKKVFVRKNKNILVEEPVPFEKEEAKIS